MKAKFLTYNILELCELIILNMLNLSFENMKNLLLFLLLPLIFITNTIDTFAEENLKKITIKTSAQCKMCKKTIEKAVKNADGIEEAKLDVKTANLNVEFDESKITASKVKELVSKAGYAADEVIADSVAYKNLHECCKLPENK